MSAIIRQITSLEDVSANVTGFRVLGSARRETTRRPPERPISAVETINSVAAARGEACGKTWPDNGIRLIAAVSDSTAIRDNGFMWPPVSLVSPEHLLM